MAELCTQALTVFNRGDLTPATPHVPRLQISLIRWEGELFPTTSLFEEEKKILIPPKFKCTCGGWGPDTNPVLGGFGGVGQVFAPVLMQQAGFSQG